MVIKMEKKLTDEEIVKALKFAIAQGEPDGIGFWNSDMKWCGFSMSDVLDLIHRLQEENADLREKNEKLYELGLNENTARFEDMKKIERLEDEVQRLAKVEMELIGKIADKSAEIERLTEVRNDFRQEVITLNNEKLELQKQVDEYFKKAYFYYQRCKMYGIEFFYDDEFEAKPAKEGKTIAFPKFKGDEVE